jgi:hypothetical protein
LKTRTFTAFKVLETCRGDILIVEQSTPEEEFTAFVEANQKTGQTS